MLDPQTIKMVKKTVPILQKNGEMITRRFYQMLFSSHPELANIFNMTHQKQYKQQRALADAIYAAAANIDQIESILPAIKRIAHKHRSIGVQPEQYPIVGENLLLAIKDVLGPAATEEIITAWAEFYSYLANLFIRIEKDLYAEAEQQPGGWAGFRDFVVYKKAEESEVITSFYLKPVDGKPIASFKPGQYISLKIEIEGEAHTHIRQYSLSDAPGRDYYRISVKREDGAGNHPPGIVSNYLHRHVTEGDILKISAPAGDFYLDTTKDTPVVLLSGGVGLTPMVSMLNTLIEQQSKREILFIHAAINSKVHAMKNHIEQMAARHSNVKSYICYEKPTVEDYRAKNFDKEGFINLPWLQAILPDLTADYYICGPVPFMRTVIDALHQIGVSDDNIHYEFFGPPIEFGETTCPVHSVA